MTFSAIYRMLKKVPILGTVLKIVNAYAYAGDLNSIDYVAPLRRWVRALLIPFFVAFLLTTFLLYDYFKFPAFGRYQFAWNGSFGLLIETWTPIFVDIKEPLDKPGQLISSAYPSLLGFGIGVYALIFALSPGSMRILQLHIDSEIDAGARKEGHALMLNASMAYPLLILALSFVPAVFQQSKPSSYILVVFTWTVFWYGIVVLLELLGLLFALGEQDGLDKIYP